MTIATRQSVGAAWRPGDAPGDRRFVDIGGVDLERGGCLPQVTVAYETWGTLARDGSNAVLVEHALTGDSHVIGPASDAHPTPGWWPDLIGPGAPLDTNEFFIVATNVLGGCQGTTGPSSPGPDGQSWGGAFPFITTRDQVRVEAAVADALGIRAWHAVIGGSMGGMRALEWACSHPDRVATAIVLASTAYATADQIAWCQPQILAIRADPLFHGGNYYRRGDGQGPVTGLGVARRIAHITYRSEQELSERFGRRPQPGEDPLGGGGRYAVESYLDHHAAKLAGRFDANSYVVLTESMNSHDVGRGRGGPEAAVAAFPGRLVVAGVDTDRLYPLHLSRELAGWGTDSRLHTIRSDHGHDGFLVEVDQVGQIIREAVTGA